MTYPPSRAGARRALPVFCLACHFSLAPDARAQAPVPVPRLPEVIVTATRLPGAPVDTPLDATVIGRDTIECSQLRDVAALLRREAGVEIQPLGGLGHQAGLFLRGTDGDQTLVLIDGVPVNSATSGAAAVDQLLPGAVERVEIVRGNVSALYGSQAVGGVIQIFTRALDDGLRLTAGAGQDGLRRLSAQGGLGGDATRLSLGVETLENDGFSALKPEFVTAPADLDDDGYRNLTLNARLHHDFDPDHALTATARHGRGDVEFDGAFQDSSEQTLATYALQTRHRLGERWRADLRLGEGQDELDSFLAGQRVSVFDTRTRQFAWDNVVDWSTDWRLSFGAERLWQDVAGATAYAATARRVTGVYAGANGNLGRQLIQLNARRDDFSDVGARTTGLLGYGFRATPALTLTAVASTAFKAPTFNDLYFPFGGNPALRPEKAESLEAGLRLRGTEAGLRLVAFDTRLDDLISFDPVSFLAVNVERARVTGLELDGDWRVAGTDLRARLTLQEPENETTGERLVRRARVYGNAGVARRVGGWDLDAEVLASGPRADFHAVTFAPVTVAGFGVVNLAARRALRPGLAVGARLENLFDKDYMRVHGYGTQGRALFVTLEAEL